MNNQEFEQRAASNPFDQSADFITATQESPARQKIVAEFQSLNYRILQANESVIATPSLQQRLLNIPIEREGASAETKKNAANDNMWIKRLLAVAASLVAVITIVFSNIPAEKSELELAVFQHIYDELFLLESKTLISLPQVNESINKTLGAQLNQNELTNNIQTTSINDCWVAEENAIHMVLEGNTGAVTVIMIPNNPIEEEIEISDARFEGIITPTTSGNLVVVGEKREAISELSNLLASNMNW